MEVFVHRQPRGFVTSQLEGPEELGELLTRYGPLGEDDEVTVEITAPWSVLRELLGLYAFRGVWCPKKGGEA